MARIQLTLLQIIVQLGIICTVVMGDERCDGCYPLVSGPKGVPDKALTASSSWGPSWLPKEGRLNGPRSWYSAQKAFSGQWIQVKFNHMSRVSKFQTQGRHGGDQWATSYKVQTSQDCQTFKDYKEDGKSKVFPGNSDRDTVVEHTLGEPVKALCFRILIVTYRHHPVLRFEVFGKQACADGYTSWMGSCYSLFQDLFTWVEAAAYCKLEGGGLLTVDDLKEHNWIVDFISKQSPRYSLLENKICSGRTLAHSTHSSLKTCLNECLIRKPCLAINSRFGKSGFECWHKSECHIDKLIWAQGLNTHPFLARSSDVWINLNRLHDHINWKSLPGIPAKHHHWALNQPSKEELMENCAAMTPSYSYKWISKKCDAKAIFICEK